MSPRMGMTSGGGGADLISDSHIWVVAAASGSPGQLAATRIVYGTPIRWTLSEGELVGTDLALGADSQSVEALNAGWYAGSVYVSVSDPGMSTWVGLEFYHSSSADFSNVTPLAAIPTAAAGAVGMTASLPLMYVPESPAFPFSVVVYSDGGTTAEMGAASLNIWRVA